MKQAVYMNRYRHVLSNQKRSIVTDKKAVVHGFGELILLGIFLTTIILFYVWSRVEVVRLGYAILEVSKEQKELSLENERLKVELSSLQAPSRLASLAKTHLNLKNPDTHQIIYMK